jgi:hypothetical protein
MRDLIDNADQLPTLLSQPDKAETKQYGDEQHRQEIALNERLDEARQNDTKQEIDQCHRPSGGRITCNGFGIQLCRVDVHPCADRPEVADVGAVWPLAEDENTRYCHADVGIFSAANLAPGREPVIGLGASMRAANQLLRNGDRTYYRQLRWGRLTCNSGSVSEGQRRRQISSIEASSTLQPFCSSSRKSCRAGDRPRHMSCRCC